MQAVDAFRCVAAAVPRERIVIVPSMAKDGRALREEAAEATASGKHKRALAAYLELERLEPRDAQWAKRAGETYRKLGNNKNAIEAFERSVDRYCAERLPRAGDRRLQADPPDRPSERERVQQARLSSTSRRGRDPPRRRASPRTTRPCIQIPTCRRFAAPARSRACSSLRRKQQRQRRSASYGPRVALGRWYRVDRRRFLRRAAQLRWGRRVDRSVAARRDPMRSGRACRARARIRARIRRARSRRRVQPPLSTQPSRKHPTTPPPSTAVADRHRPHQEQAGAAADGRGDRGRAALRADVARDDVEPGCARHSDRRGRAARARCGELAQDRRGRRNRRARRRRHRRARRAGARGHRGDSSRRAPRRCRRWRRTRSRKTPLFAGLPADALEALVSNLDARTARAGRRAVPRGRRGRRTLRDRRGRALGAGRGSAARRDGAPRGLARSSARWR